MSGHYRQPLEFSDVALAEAQARVARIRNFLLEDAVGGEDEFVAERSEAFVAALCDDFNTPRALAALFEVIAEGNRRSLPGARAAVAVMLPLLGLDSLLESGGEAGEEAEALLAEREEARTARDFDRADRARDRLAELGFEVRDTAEGPRLVPNS